MTSIIAIVGYSDSGKTTVASYLVQELTSRGFRVAAIKHCHSGHDIGKPNSDTTRLFQAGATSVTASSPGFKTKTDRVDGDTRLEDLALQMDGQFDLILAEGFKSSAVPKILVSNEAKPPPDVANLLAAVGEIELHPDIPVYPNSKLDGLVDLVQNQIKQPTENSFSIVLNVDGVQVPLSRYPTLVLRNLVEGFVDSLKDVSKNPTEISILLRK